MKRNLTAVVFFIAAGVLFSACNNTDKSSSATGEKETKPTFDLAAAKQAVEEGNKAFMDLLRKGDSVGVANLYASDAKLMSPNSPAFVGRASIQSAVAGFINAGMTGFTLKTTETWGYEGLLSEEGVWTLSDKNGKELDHGKYIVLWKMEDGKWKLFRDCWSSDTPPAK